jgi:hypothetical protein
MPPRLIEVSPDVKDFAEDGLKIAVVSLTAWVVNTYLLKNPTPIEGTLQTLAILLGGLAVHHLIVDPNIVRFVVQPGTEGYYLAMKRLT